MSCMFSPRKENHSFVCHRRRVFEGLRPHTMRPQQQKVSPSPGFTVAAKIPLSVIITVSKIKPCKSDCTRLLGPFLPPRVLIPLTQDNCPRVREEQQEESWITSRSLLTTPGKPCPPPSRALQRVRVSDGELGSCDWVIF